MSDLDPYSPIQISAAPDQEYTDSVQRQSDVASRPTQDFQSDINRNIDKSNLFGPKNPSDPQSDALSARGRQIYNSHVNAMAKQSQLQATDRQIGLEDQDVDNRAAVYANRQSRAQLNYQQTSFQRESAIAQEAMRRDLLSQIFGGLGKSAGVLAAKGVYNARNPSPTEVIGSTNGGTGFASNPSSEVV